MTTTTITTPGQAAASTLTPKKRTLTLSGTRLLSWKTVLFESLGRELHSLHIQQQERAFMATSHGLAYRSQRNDVRVH
jgi:hypothetical protein